MIDEFKYRSTFYYLKNLWNFLTVKRKYQLFLTLCLMILTSIFELFSLASLIPFISVLISPEKVLEIRIINLIFNSFQISSRQEIIIFCTFIFISVALFSSAVRILSLWCNTRVIAFVGNDLSCLAYKKTLQQKYLTHINRNSSEVVSTLVTEINDLVLALNSVLIVLTNTFISISIVFTLFLISWKISISSLGIFSLTYFLISRITQEKIQKRGIRISKSAKDQLKSMQESFGGIRDLILDNNFKIYEKKYYENDYIKRIKFAEINFLGFFPRFLMEGFSLAVFAFIGVLLLKNSNNPEQIIPILGATALGIQKLLPSMQQTYSGLSAIKGYKKVMANVLGYLNQKSFYFSSSEIYKPLPFNKKIELKNVSFRYKGSKNEIIKNVNLKINKGEFIGIIGKTGCGKSTFLDIIMGLVEPTAGDIKIDDKNIFDLKNLNNLKRWHSSFAHVPQNIYLLDDSILNNIIMNKKNQTINYQHLKNCCEKAEISNFIKNTKDNLHTKIGERGVLLSGGQLQRIGIARALFKDLDLLILDEATSSLDKNTEEKVMKNILKLKTNITIIAIAHRTSTLTKCDRIFKFENCNLTEVKSNKIP